MFEMRTGSILSVLAALLMFVLAGCSGRDPIFPIEPQITFVSMTPGEIPEFDPFEITIRFQDGDGDLGSRGSADTLKDLYIVDTRDIPPGLEYTGVYSYSFEDLMPDARQPSIQGSITIRFESLVGPGILNPTADREEVVFKIYLYDRVGHKSNEVLTPPLVLTR